MDASVRVVIVILVQMMNTYTAMIAERWPRFVWTACSYHALAIAGSMSVRSVPKSLGPNRNAVNVNVVSVSSWKIVIFATPVCKKSRDWIRTKHLLPHTVWSNALPIELPTPTPGKAWTCDLLIRSQLLYQLSYRSPSIGVGLVTFASIYLYCFVTYLQKRGEPWIQGTFASMNTIVA